MENIPLTDDLVVYPIVSNGQQNVTSTFANTDIIKASNGSSGLFQQKSNAIPPLNPLFQPLTPISQFPSTLIQTNIRPPAIPTSFAPLNQHMSTQSVRFPSPNVESTNVPPSMIRPSPPVQSQNVQLNSQLPQFVPPPPPPPPQQTASSSTATNPYSARASLSERIYPSMPTTQTSFEPPVPFQQQIAPLSSSSNLFVPTMPPTDATVASFVSNTYPESDTNISNSTYQLPGNYNPNYPSTTYDQSSANPNGIWSWFNNNKMLATVVEKAKTGIETVMTTVDPQMKQYIQPGHEVHLVVTSTNEIKLTSIRDAFSHVFGRAITQGIDIQSNIARQPIGFAAGVKGAQLCIENIRRQNLIRSDQCIISIQNFLAELIPDMYFDLNYILLSDPFNSIELHLFTQAIPIPIEYVYQARDRTSSDYPLKSSGYMITIGEIIHSQLPFVNPEDWQETMSGTSTKDILYATCKTLAYMYKQRLNRKQ